MTHQPISALPRPAGIERDAGLTRSMTTFMAASVGVIFLNVPAPQTLIGVIGPAIGLDPTWYGLVATAPLLGYAFGLFFVTPLADLFENRALITRTLGGAVLFASATTFTHGPILFLALVFLLGVTSSAVQMVVPLAATLTTLERRGRVIGDIMSGIMIGILLSRPLASIIQHAFGWRAFYRMTAVALAVVTIGFAWILPRHQPRTEGGYARLLASLVTLFRAEPVLRRRALTASLGMASFSTFWTAIALELSTTRFHLDQTGIAVFALAGASGAVIAPLAGRAGDRGWTRPGTVLAHLATLSAFALAALGDRLGLDLPERGIAILAVSAVLLDIGVIADQTFGRRAINLLRQNAGARLNGLFVGLFFIGGAIGSALVGLVWTAAGWPGVCVLGSAFALLSLLTDLAVAR